MTKKKKLDSLPHHDEEEVNVDTPRKKKKKVDSRQHHDEEEGDMDTPRKAEPPKSRTPKQSGKKKQLEAERPSKSVGKKSA